MLNKVKKGSNMYGWVYATWNTILGRCNHNCSYCYNLGRNFFEGELRLNEKSFKDNFGEGNTIFVGSSNDLFQDAVPEEWIVKTLEHCKKYPNNKYVFQTKNPKRFFEFLDHFPKKTMLGCYDEKTRILTLDGFKTYNEIKKGDSVFTLNPKTKNIEINKIKDIFIYQYNGKMLRFKGRRLNFLVTPNHKILRTCNKRFNLKFEEASKVAKRFNFYFPKGKWKIKSDIQSFNIDEKIIDMKDISYLIGIFIGDGWIDQSKLKRIVRTGLDYKTWLKKAKNNGKPFKKLSSNPLIKFYPKSRIILCIPKLDKARKKVENILQKYDIKYSSYEETIYFCSKEWHNLFKECGKGAKNKTIPKWLLKQNTYYLKSLFEGIMDSDGCENRRLVTTSSFLVDTFTELCMKLGKTAHTTKYVKKKGLSLPNNRKTKNDTISYFISVADSMPFLTKKNVTEENYDGNVWCCSVKNKNFFVENNGIGFFCGNSTIESNRNYNITKAPFPWQRYEDFLGVLPKGYKKFVSVEPVLDFDLPTFVYWIINLEPEFVSIGADSKKHDLPEPSKEKIKMLIDELKKHTEVKVKDNLKRITK